MKEACEAWSGGANRMYEERHPPPNCTDPTGWECEWELLPSEVLRAHSEVASNCSRAAEYAAAQNRTLEGEQCLRCWDVCMANLAEHMRESMFWSKWLSWLLVLQVCVGAPGARRSRVFLTPPPPPEHLLTSFHTVLIVKFGGQLPTFPSF